MKIVFWTSDKPHERLLADAFARGVRVHGDEIVVRPLLPEVAVEDCDVACMVGVKSSELFHEHWRRKIHTVYLDKGYTRHAAPGPVKVWEYWRVAVDAHQPTEMLKRMKHGSDRWDKLGLSWKPWRKSGKQIVIAGSSQKYHTFYNMRQPTAYWQKTIGVIRDFSAREIVYRPKPSWKEAVPIEGTRYSQRPRDIEQELEGAHCLITHGSNACFEAVLAGVPCVILGDAVAKSISSNDLSEIESLKLASEEDRQQWFNNLAYCQWKMSEFASGETWNIVRPFIYG